MVNTAVLSSELDSRKHSVAAPRHGGSVTPSAHSVAQQALNQQIQLHQQHATKKLPHRLPRNMHTERDEAIKKRVFSFPEVRSHHQIRTRNSTEQQS